MSIEAVNWALNTIVNITSTQKAILVALADRADVNGLCYPAYDDICRRSCATRHAVANALRHFESMGLIKRKRRYNKSTIYQLCISAEINTTASSAEINTATSAEINTASSVEIDTLTIIEPSKEPSYRARFSEFWGLYPKKVAKPAAERAFKNLTKKDQMALVDGVKGYSFAIERRYIPNPSTFINQRRWEDENETTTKSETGGLYI